MHTDSKKHETHTDAKLPLRGRYSFDDIMKFSDGWWITFWHPAQGRVIKSNGPYKTKDEAKQDVLVLNAH